MKNYDLYKHQQIMTLKELLKFCSITHNDKTAFVYKNCKQDITVSYNTFYDDVKALGTYLYKKGYKNSKIAILGENSYEWILSHFSVTCGKDIVVPIDKELEIKDIKNLLQDSESSVLIYSNIYLDIIEELQKCSNLNVKFLNMKNIPSMIKEGNEFFKSGYTEYVDVEINKDDIASIVYTSGTTGKSKGVMLSHYNFMSCMHGACRNVLLSGNSLLLLPLHHTFGLVASVYAVMFYGFSIYINKSLKRLSSDFQTAKPQHLFAVPLIVETLYKNIWTTAKKQGKDKLLYTLIKISDNLLKVKIDLRRIFFKTIILSLGGNLDLIISGGAPIDKKYITAFKSLGITVLNGYGITECGPIVAVNRNKFNIVGSVGLPLCCNTVKISDENEILVKGDNVMVGYYNNPTENKKVFCDGWFKTGDLGYIDSFGALHVTGRIKNLIILGNGENIPAETIEEYIHTIPYVKEVVAYGKDNIIVAEVYLDEELYSNDKDIHKDIKEINQKLPLNYNIGKVIIRDKEFSKTTTKKIKRDYGG